MHSLFKPTLRYFPFFPFYSDLKIHWTFHCFFPTRKKNSPFPFLKLSLFLVAVVTNCRKGGLLVVLLPVFSMLFSPTVPCGSSLAVNSCIHLNSYKSKCKKARALRVKAELFLIYREHLTVVQFLPVFVSLLLIGFPTHPHCYTHPSSSLGAPWDKGTNKKAFVKMTVSGEIKYHYVKWICWHSSPNLAPIKL